VGSGDTAPARQWLLRRVEICEDANQANQVRIQPCGGTAASSEVSLPKLLVEGSMRDNPSPAANTISIPTAFKSSGQVRRPLPWARLDSRPLAAFANCGRSAARQIRWCSFHPFHQYHRVAGSPGGGGITEEVLIERTKRVERRTRLVAHPLCERTSYSIASRYRGLAVTISTRAAISTLAIGSAVRSMEWESPGPT